MTNFLKRRLGPHWLALTLLGVVCAWYGGSKGVYAQWDEFFRDTSVSVETNEWRTVTFEWTCAPATPPAATANFYTVPLVDLKDDEGEADLTLVGSAAMTALAWSWTAEAGDSPTNYHWYVQCSHSSGPTVVTNGVYHVTCAATNGLTLKWVPVGVRTYDGRGVSWRRMSPPAGAVEPDKPGRSTLEASEGGAE